MDCRYVAMAPMADRRVVCALVLAGCLLSAAAQGEDEMCKATEALSMDEAKFLAATGRIASAKIMTCGG